MVMYYKHNATQLISGPSTPLHISVSSDVCMLLLTIHCVPCVPMAPDGRHRCCCLLLLLLLLKGFAYPFACGAGIQLALNLVRFASGLLLRRKPPALMMTTTAMTMDHPTTSSSSATLSRLLFRRNNYRPALFLGSFGGVFKVTL